MRKGLIFTLSVIAVALLANLLALYFIRTNRSFNPQSLITNVMKSCTQSPVEQSKTTINPTQIFRIFLLDPPISGPTITGTVTYSPPVTGSGAYSETAEEAVDTQAAGSTNHWYRSGAYPFHVDLVKDFGVPLSGYVMIRVILPTGGNYKFKTMNDAGTEIDGLGVGEPSLSSNLCKFTNSIMANGRVAIFYASVGKPSGSNPEPFNVVIEASATDDTPIIIDPKVHQPGD